MAADVSGAEAWIAPITNVSDFIWGGTWNGEAVIPFPPMTFKMAESGGRFQIPVVPGEDEQDFALVLSLIGLEIDPFLWGMIDPGGQLPQDPATLVIDTNGKLILTQDIFAPEFAEQPMMAPPGQINALTVNRIAAPSG